MNNKFKKIIAREFLIFLVMLILGIVVFLCIYPYNSYRENQIEKVNKSITEKELLADSLHKSVNKKIENQEWFFDKVSNEFDIINTEYSELKSLWPILQRIAENDSTEYRWNHKWEKSLIQFHKSIGFKNAQELENFIEQNSINSKDSVQLGKSTEIRKEIAKLTKQKDRLKRKVFNDYEKEGFAIGIGVVLFGILFLLRYLIYAVKWSLRTLKE